MSETNVMSVWDNPRNVEALQDMWMHGASASEIARALGDGCTRNMVIGKVHRLKLQRRDNSIRPRTIAGGVAKNGRSGGVGQTKANVIRHRVEGRLKAERARQAGKLASIDNIPFREGSVPSLDDGVDARHLIAFEQRKIGQQCAWIPGDPLDGAMCCGKPVEVGSQWCAEHHARVYAGRAALA